jgi:hypothetical protein
MTLFPGGPRQVGGQFVLDDTALQDTLAKAIEEEMADVFQKVKWMPLPEPGKADRRLLFVAIARGVLKYLEAHQNDVLASVTINHTTGPSVTHTVSNVDLNITMDK